MADSILIGLSALQAHKRSLEVIGHNIANAATPGYSRQTVALVTPTPESVRPGQLGRGVTVQSITRITDTLLTDRLRQTQAETGRLEGLVPTLQAIEDVFNEPGDNGLTATVNTLFASFDDLASNPESTSIRSKAVQDLSALTSTFNDLDTRLNQLKEDLRSALAQAAIEINGLTEELHEVNLNIKAETLLGNEPNDLLDRRDMLLNQLSKIADIGVRYNDDDNGALVTMGGRLVFDQNGAAAVEVGSNGLGDLALVFSDNGAAADITSGSIGAILDLANRIIPQVQEQLDSLAEKLIYNLNAMNATGVNQNFDGSVFISEYIVAAAETGLDLDDVEGAMTDEVPIGMPENFLPSFTDETGASIARNLTINVFDTETQLAEKYIVRYEPGSGPVPATRSFDDLISAINTGRGGGFRLYPSGAGGIPGITASAVADEGGVRLRLQADTNKSIDFSRAQDVRPSDTAWTGGTALVSGTDATLANERLEFVVQNGGTELRVFTRDPVDGSELAYGPGTIAIPTAGAVALGALTLDASAGAYVDDQAFAVDFDSAGAVVTKGPVAGTHQEDAVWTAGDASMTVRGRYTGTLSFDPTLPWSMRVLSSGVVGADDAAVIPNNPPVVEFTYYVKEGGVVTQHTAQKTLNQSLPAGHAVEIADGIYTVFGAGALTAGNQLDFAVDGDPDAAGLLPALGINGMMSGFEAGSMAVAQRLLQDPSQLGVAHTRSAGDNANVTTFSGLRARALFGTGQTFDESFQSMVFDIGVQVSQNKRFQENQAIVEKSLQNRRDAQNGVNIDEEVGNLILEQQAYAAAARVITSAKENMETLLNILR